MYKSKHLFIVSKPRGMGKTWSAKRLSEKLGIPILRSGPSPDAYRGFRSVILDDIPEEKVLDMTHSDPLINSMEEVYYFRTFLQDPKDYFVSKIPRTWAVTLERYSREQL